MQVVQESSEDLVYFVFIKRSDGLQPIKSWRCTNFDPIALYILAYWFLYQLLAVKVLCIPSVNYNKPTLMTLTFKKYKKSIWWKLSPYSGDHWVAVGLLAYAVLTNITTWKPLKISKNLNVGLVSEKIVVLTDYYDYQIDH